MAKIGTNDTNQTPPNTRPARSTPLWQSWIHLWCLYYNCWQYLCWIIRLSVHTLWLLSTCKKVLFKTYDFDRHQPCSQALANTNPVLTIGYDFFLTAVVLAIESGAIPVLCSCISFKHEWNSLDSVSQENDVKRPKFVNHFTTQLELNLIS